MRLIQNNENYYAVIKRGVYKKYRSLDYEIQQEYFNQGLEMPFITKEWYEFYNEEMNLLMQKKPFQYFYDGSSIYAYHNTLDTTIKLTDDDKQNAIILTRVYGFGAFDNPTDYQDLKIY